MMWRCRLSSQMVGKAIGVHPVTVRRWRSGDRTPRPAQIRALENLFRQRGVEPPATPQQIDPREIEPPPVDHRVTIAPRDDAIPAPSTLSIITTLNSALKPLMRPAVAQRPPAKAGATAGAATPRPPTPPPAFAGAAAPRHATPRNPAPALARCAWVSTAPGEQGVRCAQLAAPGSTLCALHRLHAVRIA
jgi:hypothetical protein